MRRRLSLIAGAVLMLCLLVLPASAAAGSTYSVKNAAGHSVGSIFPKKQAGVWGATVHTVSGKLVGAVQIMDGYWVVGGSSPQFMNMLTRTADSVWSVRGSSGSVYPGRAKHKGSRWLLQKRVKGNWKTRGSVPGSCLGPFAAGALRSLLWR